MPSYKDVFKKISLLTLGAKCNFLNLIGYLYLTPGMKIKIQKPYCISTRYIHSYPLASFVYYLKCRWSSSEKSYMTENVIVRPSYDPRGQNVNFESLLHICITCPIISSIVYSWKCRCSWSDKLCRKKETSFFNPHLTPRDIKMKIPKPYCISSRHTQSYLRVSFVYSMKCRQSSCDNRHF